MSTTSTPSPAVPSMRRWATPSVSIVTQNGQAAVTRSGESASASSVRLRLIRVPRSSSIHIRAPPAPQQNDCSLVRGISVRVSPGTAPSTSRGAAKTRLCRPR